jgi:hypothetical protein
VERLAGFHVGEAVVDLGQFSAWLRSSPPGAICRSVAPSLGASWSFAGLFVSLPVVSLLESLEPALNDIRPGLPSTLLDEIRDDGTHLSRRRTQFSNSWHV